MALSLTKDELLERFADRGKLVETMLKHDWEGTTIPIDLFHGEDGLWHIRATEFIAKLVASTLVRMIELSYREE